MGVARIFQRGGGGGHTESYRGYSPDCCHLNIVGCLLTKRLTKGGGGVTGTPGLPPGYTLVSYLITCHQGSRT